MNSFIVNWKSSANGILAFLITTGTVLLATGNALFSQKATLYVTIGLALCRAYVGLIEKDAGATQAPSSSSSTLKSIAVLAVLVMFSTLTGCPKSSLHQAAVATDSIASSLQTAENINREAFTQGIETAQERDAVGGYIANAARANDALVATVQAAEQSGSSSVPQTVIAAFSTLVTQVNTLNSEGVLKLKSTQAQQEFQVVVAALQTQLAVLQQLVAHGAAAPAVPAVKPVAMLLARF